MMDKITFPIGSMKPFRHVITCALLLCMLPLSSVAAAREPSQNRQWKARYKMGSRMEAAVKEDSKMIVIIGRQSILCETEKESGFLIPVQQVVGVTYDNIAKRRSYLYAVAAVPFVISAYSPNIFSPPEFPRLLETLIWAGAIVALTEVVKTKDHFVNILWQDGDRIKEAVFELGKKDYLAFLDQLQSVTGKGWANLPRMRETMRQELEDNQDEAIPVQLDQRVSFREAIIPPDLYQVVFLKRQEQYGALYFFRGSKVKTKNMVVVVPVEVLPRGEDSTASEVLYKEQPHGQTPSISEIRVEGRVFRFP